MASAATQLGANKAKRGWEVWELIKQSSER